MVSDHGLGKGPDHGLGVDPESVKRVSLTTLMCAALSLLSPQGPSARQEL